jgi:hypothetical protein
MGRIVTVLQGAILLVASIAVFLLPPLTLLAVLLARWDDEPTPGTYDPRPTIRGDVPRWLRWLQTNDERLPGGLHEPTVDRVMQRYGRTMAAWYWIAVRNRAHGLRRVFSQPVTPESAAMAFPRVDGKASGRRPDGTWFWSRDFGPLRVVAGHRIYLYPQGHVAVPTLTVKRAGK